MSTIENVTDTNANREDRRSRRWRDLRIGVRLCLGFALVGLMLLLTGGVGIAGQASLAHEVDRMKTEALAQTSAVDDLKIELLEVRIGVLRHLAVTDPAKLADAASTIVDADKKLDEQLAALDELETSADARADVEAFKTALRDYRSIRDTKVLAASAAGDKKTATEIATGEAATAFAGAVKAADTLMARADREAARLDRSASATYERGRLLSMVFLAAGIVIAIAAGLVITRSVTRPAVAMVDALALVASGDLRARADYQAGDEIGQMAASLNRALDATQAAMASIGEQSEQLTAAATDLAAIATELSATASQTTSQAATVSAAANQVSMSVQTVAASAEEMGATVHEIARSSAEASTVASTAVALATNASELIGRLGRSSAEISQVVTLITGIAEQTNLLALNATIEAARAGEAGRGFAVVANEVKELAQQTATATATIRSTVDTIQADTTEAVNGIEQIALVIVGVNDQQTAIAGAVEEQSATTNELGRTVADAAVGVDAIAGNISDIAQASEANTQAAGDASRSASQLTTMAGELRALLSRFQY